MCSNHSRALLLVSALVLCGCAAPREPKAPISYRQRTNPPSRPADAQSVVYHREVPRPQAKATPREQPSGVILGRLADEGKDLRREPVPAVPSVTPQSVRPEPNRQSPPVEPKRNDLSPDDAKLKALYDSGFLTREEFLRAGSVK